MNEFHLFYFTVFGLTLTVSLLVMQGIINAMTVKIADAWTWSGVVSLPSSGERVTTEPFNPGFMTTYLQLM